MELAELVRAAGVPAELRGDGTAEISKLAYDSRAVEAGTLFFCVRGMSSDGHEFAPGAVEAGASALVVERPLDLGVPEVQVADARAAMAPLAAAFHGDPTLELALVGVTGTNGKTTTAFLVRSLLEAAGRRCGLLGTVHRVVGGEVEEVERTTPEAIDLQGTFERMLEAGDQACVMEVSSHALVLHRADAIHFDVKVFTNLTQDHLDFHSDMEDYFAAKRLLFSAEGGAPLLELEGGVSVVNVDDEYGRRLAEELQQEGVAEALLTFSRVGRRRRPLGPRGQLRRFGGEFRRQDSRGGAAGANHAARALQRRERAGRARGGTRAGFGPGRRRGGACRRSPGSRAL